MGDRTGDDSIPPHESTAPSTSPHATSEFFTIDVANEQSLVSVSSRLVRRAVHAVLAGEGARRAIISVAIVDDSTIHKLNREYLAHDYPTDVLSFLLDGSPQQPEGEVIVSAETALRQASEYDSAPIDELLLYVIHGTLHLMGYDDGTERERRLMEQKQRAYLQRFEQRHRRPGSSDTSIEG